jgi:hypothetical protein
MFVVASLKKIYYKFDQQNIILYHKIISLEMSFIYESNDIIL